VLSSWQENSITVGLGQTILADIPVYCFCVLSIVEAHNYAATTKVKAKKQLHEQVDVEMADATKPGPSIQSMINKAVATRFKKSPPKGGAKKVSLSTSSFHTHLNSYLEFEGQQGWEEEKDHFPIFQEGVGSTSVLYPQGRAQASSSDEDGP